MQRLFIYRALGPDGPNDNVMPGISGEWQSASTRGRLVKEGWVAHMGYPGWYRMMMDLVRGNMFASEKLEENRHALDEFEGASYERVLTAVTPRRSSRIQAYVHALRTGRSA